MKKAIFITLFMLPFLNIKSQILTDGEYKIGLYALINNGEVTNSAIPASHKSYIYVKNESNAIAIFLDGILIEALVYDKNAIKKDGNVYIFQAKSMNDLIDRECIINTAPEETSGFVNFAIRRGNGALDMYSIMK